MLVKRFGSFASLIVLFATASALSEPVTLHRTFKEGQKDAFQMLMAEHLDNFDADVESSWTETVSHVAPDGSADVKLESTSFRISANGTDIPEALGPAPQTLHFGPGGNLNGSPVEDSSVSRLIPDLFASYAYNKLDPSHELKLDEKASNQSLSGTVSLTEVHDGIAKVKLKLQYSWAGEQMPMHVEATASFSVADSKLQSIEGTIRDLPKRMTSRYNVASADFKVKRLP